MTAEYTVEEGQTVGQLARELLGAAEELGQSPDVIAWTHRPDTPGGGVFIVTSDEVAAKVLERRRVQAEREAAAEEAQPDDELGEDDGSDSDESGEESAPEDGKPLTAAQKRRAAKQAKAKADAEAKPETPAEAQTETPAPQAGAEQNAE